MVPKITEGIWLVLMRTVASATFEVLLLSIAYKFSAKKELSLMTLKKDPNFKEKLTFV